MMRLLHTYQATFKRGNGNWKNYYYEESKLREEGMVTNNHKVGVWKYYNLFGNIDSTKTDTIKDVVDVRFPYVFFNKTEPYRPINKVEPSYCH